MIEEVQQPSDDPLASQDRETMLVGIRNDPAAAAAQRTRPEAGNVQMAASRELGGHRPVEMDVEMVEEVARVLKRSREGTDNRWLAREHPDAVDDRGHDGERTVASGGVHGHLSGELSDPHFNSRGEHPQCVVYDWC